MPATQSTLYEFLKSTEYTEWNQLTSAKKFRSVDSTDESNLNEIVHVQFEMVWYRQEWCMFPHAMPNC